MAPTATFRRLLVVSIAAILALTAVHAQQKPPVAQVSAASFGEPFPAAIYGNLNSQAGGPEKIDLAQDLGTRSVVLFYWVAGHPRADALFGQLQTLVDELGADKLALYGVAMPQAGRDATAIAARLAELGIKVPVLDDEGFRIGQQLRVQSVPNVTVIDRGGRLRLTNGASLSQVLGYEMDVSKVIRRAAEKGSLGTYGFLDRYYPVNEMIGKKCPDFTAPLLSNKVEQRWSSMLSPEKLNVLIFWSVDCPHCRKTLPEINTWLKTNSEGVNVISAAMVPNDAVRTKTKEYCDLNGFVFPTLIDDAEISMLYQVTATPTILLIRPDGVIDSVLSPTADFGTAVDETRTRLNKS